MKGPDILALRAELKVTTQTKLAALLGLSVRQLDRYLERDELPQIFALACAALVAGLKPYTPHIRDKVAVRYYGGKAVDRLAAQKEDAA